jgi:rhodanese-related sulfurtransferase
MAEQLRIDPADAKARVDAGEAIVVDAVAPMAWDQLDIAISGAIRMAPDSIDTRWSELPRDRDIVVYCT